MAEVSPRPRDDVSVFAIGTSLLRNRWRILRWMLIGGALATAWVVISPLEYEASASFVPQGADPGKTGLANLAGQLGVSIPGTGQTLTPEFYARLLSSRVLLGSIVNDTFAVRELGGRKIPFLTLLKVDDGPPATRQEKGVKLLLNMVTSSVDKATGIVEVDVTTRWPSVSLAVTTALVNGVNEFNSRTRQDQAAAERKFVEGRLAVATSDLRAAEDRLEEFLATNRQIGNAPELLFRRDRLQRDVNLKQQVYNTLTDSYEEVRIREVRDTPVITIIEPPAVSSLPEARRRAARILLGLILGALIGALLSFSSEALSRVREEGDPEADQFVGTLGEIKAEILSPVRWLRRRGAG
jgi:uncharacterized protein involved in exopolysaccharide biosynthesis